LTENEPRIFLCHASDDKARVRELYHQLKAAGYHPWLDEEDLLPGQAWWATIRKVISDPYNLVVVCLSSNSITKRGVVQREIKRALDVLEEMPEDTIYLIPARLGDCQVPDRLSDLHCVDLFEPDGFGKLKGALDFEISRRQPQFEPELILIPAGEFLMGSDKIIDKSADDNEQPQHTVNLLEYYISKTPVTNAQYASFTAAIDHHAPYHWKRGQPPGGKEDHPAVVVSWHDAMAYCEWLAVITGKAYRLPTEAEWEKAARGADGRIYPWGNQWDPKRCNSQEGGPGRTTAVGQYSPQWDSLYGCVDMVGNVWEWCHSSYKSYPYDPDDDREDPEARGDRVLRGGAFATQRPVRCAARRGNPQINRYYDIGFRVCVASRQG
jgi:formylglycine-generating enzyme required for sulfatase activity